MRTTAKSLLPKVEQEKRKLLCTFGVYPGDFVLDMTHIAGVDMIIINQVSEN